MRGEKKESQKTGTTINSAFEESMDAFEQESQHSPDNTCGMLTV